MTIQLETDIEKSGPSDVRRSLVLIWREPSSRRFARVGRFEVLASGGFRFSYEPGVSTLTAFFPLDEYPSIGDKKTSSSLPAFFRNRIMSAERGSYPQYLEWLGLAAEELTEEDLPLEILLRSGGGRATDTFHVVEEPKSTDGQFVARFFVSGVSHLPAVEDVIAGLRAGDRLVLRGEPANDVNRLAVALDDVAGAQVGWVPDWLCQEVADLTARGFNLRAFVERINAGAPDHVRVLCRLEGRRAGH